MAQTRTSVQSGNWSSKDTWDCDCVPASTDNAVIAAGHTVTFNAPYGIHHLTVNTGGVIMDNGQDNTITGNLTVNGTYGGSGKIILTGVNTMIDGVGSISNTSSIQITNGNKIIAATANLVKGIGGLNITGAITVTNNGNITIGGSISGSVSGSTWINAANATLNIGNALLTKGTLYTSALNNTVNYYGSIAQNIKAPATVSGQSTYYHLMATGSNNKTLPQVELYVEGNLTINATLNGNGSTRILHLRGNWINNGNFTEGSGTVIFDGITDQYLSRLGGDEKFNNLVISKSSGTLFLNTDVTVGTSSNLNASSVLTMAGGNINAGSYMLTLGKGSGTSAAFSGELVYTSGLIVGAFKRYINATGSAIIFPIGTIGTSAQSRQVTITFNQLHEGSLIAQFNTASPGRSGLSLFENGVGIYNTFRDGYWALTTPEEDSLSSTDYNLELAADGFSGFPVVPDTRLLTRSGSGSPWMLSGTHISASEGLVRRMNVTTLPGEYAFGDTTNCPAPSTSSITGNTVICKNASGEIYSVPDNASNTYAWSVVGGTVASGQGTSSVTVDWYATGTAGRVSVVETNSCTSGSEITLPVNVNPMAPTSIVGRLNVPENGATPESYSVFSESTYTFTWIVLGGTLVNGQGTSAITVSWGDAGTGSVCVVASDASCGISASTCVNVNIYAFISSVQSGNWNTSSVWDCACVPSANDNVTINRTHNISLGNNSRIVNHLVIHAGGMLTTNTRSLTVNGNFVLNGVLTNGTSGTGTVTLAGLNTNVDGTGVITTPNVLYITGSKNILSSASISKSAGEINLAAGVTVTNHGAVTLTGDLAGADATSVWVNAENAVLNIGGALLTTGTLNVSATDNTIRYTGAGSQSIKLPASAQYFHLAYAGNGEKTAPSTTLHIKGSFTGDGNWVHNYGTINFNGASILSGTATPNFYNLIIEGSLTASNASIHVAGSFINNGTFEHNNGTIDFNGNTSISGRITPVFHNIEITGVLSSPALLIVAGDFTNNGTFYAGTGNVSFAGARTQYIKGNSITSFNDLTISNVSVPSVSVETRQNLLGMLTLESNTIFDADGSLDSATFTLVSASDSVDARIVTIPANASVIGKVNVQRYMSGEGRIYRYLSSPITNATVADWMDDFPVTGDFNDPSGYSSWPKTICGSVLKSESASLYFYDETKPGSASSGYVAYPNANTNAADNQLEVGRGYAPFIRQCNAPTIVDVKGTVNQGAIPIRVTYTLTSDDDVASAGWNLVGNPYPSAIDWNLDGDLNGNGDSIEVVDGWSKVNIAAAIAIKDNDSGLFRYWDGDGDNGLAVVPAGIISTAQGFWVRATGVNPMLVIREGVKTKSHSEFFRKATVPGLVISMKQGVLEDQAFVKIRSASKTTLDYWDAPKLDNDFFDIATVSDDGLPMAINALPQINCQSVVRIKMTDLTNGSYDIKISAHGNFDHTCHLTVIDHFTKSSVALEWDEAFTFKVTDDVASKASDRFTLLIDRSSPEKVEVEATSNLCHQNGNIVIRNTEDGVSYGVWTAEHAEIIQSVKGNGGEIILPLLLSNLNKGENALFVNAENGCGIYPVTSAIVVNVEDPVVEQTYSGTSCQAGSIQLSVSSADEGTFRWYASPGSNVVLHEGDFFQTPVLDKSQTYYVSLITPLGCESPHAAVEATIINFDTPVITAEGNTLMLNDSYDEVQWYLNDAPIDDETASTLIVKASGLYAAVVNTAGCEEKAEKAFFVTALEDQASILKAYPNPTSGKLFIEVPSFLSVKHMYFSTATGVMSELPFSILSDTQILLDITTIEEGFYAFYVDLGRFQCTFKIEKMHR